MKSCEFVKGKLGLSQYEDEEVFAGYRMTKLEDRHYISDSDEKLIYENIQNIRLRVIRNCKPKTIC